jgi:hypothetical protein
LTLFFTRPVPPHGRKPVIEGLFIIEFLLVNNHYAGLYVSGVGHARQGGASYGCKFKQIYINVQILASFEG